MRKEWMLLLVSVTLTTAIALVLVRWLAPELLGKPRDLQLVQVDEKIPPYYNNIFRTEHATSTEFLLQDPLTRVRAKPLYPDVGGAGPHDLLGFRNHEVPNYADVIAIGDSQTYGNNVGINENWPHRLAHYLREEKSRVYSMATGGWAAVQYLDMMDKALWLQPRVVIVAYYTGNDPVESFGMAYDNPAWAFLKTDPNLSGKDLPTATFPAPPEESWTVQFKNGSKTVLTPNLRLTSNKDVPSIKASYAIMAETAKRIGNLAQQAGVKLVFTIIPTKELAFEKKLAADGIKYDPVYHELVTQEKGHIKHLAEQFAAVPGAIYVDCISALQNRVLESPDAYPDNENGHPYAPGYDAVAAALAPAVQELLPKPQYGFRLLEVIPQQQYSPVLLTKNGVMQFANESLIEQNGWQAGDIPVVTRRDIINMPFAGVIDSVDPVRYGPQAFKD